MGHTHPRRADKMEDARMKSRKRGKCEKEVSERGPRTKDKGQDLLMSLDLSRGANQISRPKDF